MGFGALLLDEASGLGVEKGVVCRRAQRPARSCEAADVVICAEMLGGTTSVSAVGTVSTVGGTLDRDGGRHIGGVAINGVL